MKLLKYFPLTKIDERTHRVSGEATAEKPDHEGEICDYVAAKAAYKKWADAAVSSTKAAGQDASYGNIRLQHGMAIGGKVAEYPVFDDVHKSVFLHTEPKDEVYPDLKRGFYRGFSQGGDYEWRQCNECGTDMPSGRKCPKCNKTVLVRYAPIVTEVSYVDNPCLKTATFSMVKADGAEVEVSFLSPQDAFLAKLKDSFSMLKAHAQELGRGAVGDEARQMGEDFTKTLDDMRAQPTEGSDDVRVPVEFKPALKACLEARLAKAKEDPKLSKSMFNIGRLADLLSNLFYLHQDVAWEGKFENGVGDPRDEAVATQLEGVAEKLVSALKDVVNEETEELLDKIENNAKGIRNEAVAATGPTPPLVRVSAAAEKPEGEQMNKKDENGALAKRKSVAAHLDKTLKTIADSNTAMLAAISASFTKTNEALTGLAKLMGAEDMQDLGDNDPEAIDLEAAGTSDGRSDGSSAADKAAKAAKAKKAKKAAGENVTMTKAELDNLLAKAIEKAKKAASSDASSAGSSAASYGKCAPGSSAASSGAMSKGHKKADKSTFTKAEVEELVSKGINEGLQTILKAMADSSGASSGASSGGYSKADAATKLKKQKGVGDRTQAPVIAGGNGPHIRVMPVTKSMDGTQQQAAETVELTSSDIAKAASGDPDAGLKLMKGVRSTTNVPPTVASAISSLR